MKNSSEMEISRMKGDLLSPSDDVVFLHSVGYRIADARRIERLSQLDLARLSGIPQSQLSEIESGKRSLRVEQLRVIAFLLKVRLSYLLGE